MGNFNYFFTIVDNYTRFVWNVLLIDKSCIFKAIHTFILMVQTQFGTKIKVVKTDNE